MARYPPTSPTSARTFRQSASQRWGCGPCCRCRPSVPSSYRPIILAEAPKFEARRRAWSIAFAWTIDGQGDSPMPYAQSNGVKLYFEETGAGHPIIFVHEFGSDHREWETQVRYFSRNYRCITYNARGYPPSDVPEDDASYGQDHATDDVAAVLKHLNIAQAHVVGLSMGAFATLHFGLRYPQMASALVAAGCGSGAPKSERETFAKQCNATAERFLKDGSA